MMTSAPAQQLATQTAAKTRRPFRFTGWHMWAIMIAFFGTVIGVNWYMAYLAVSGFTGEVVENSYDASQKFDTWLDAAARDKALGWSAKVTHRADGRLVVHMTGKGTRSGALTVEAWRPLGDPANHMLAFTPADGAADGAYVSTTPLAMGRWHMKLLLVANGHQWHGASDL